MRSLALATVCEPTPETVNFRSIFLTGLLSVTDCANAPKLVVGWSDCTYVSAVGVKVRLVGRLVCVGVGVFVEVDPPVGVGPVVLLNPIETTEVSLAWRAFR